MSATITPRLVEVRCTQCQRRLLDYVKAHVTDVRKVILQPYLRLSHSVAAPSPPQSAGTDRDQRRAREQ